MYKITQLMGLASLLLLGSCSSDDSRPGSDPTSKHYVLKQVNTIYYAVESDATGNHTSSTETRQVSYNFYYTDSNQLDSIRRDSHVFKTGVPTMPIPHGVKYQLNESLDLISYEVKDKDYPITNHTFTYDNGLVKNYKVSDIDLGFYEHQLEYNSNKQFVKSHSTNMTSGAEFEVNYSYNTKGELVQLTNTSNYTVNFTYDKGKNPFYSLPFDLTTLIFHDLYYIPITYAFPHNINSYKIGKEPAFTFDYTYNEDHFPIKTTIYKGAKTKSNLHMAIHYDYHIVPSI
ncbi:hypothetical protein [Myroides sp. WP-1]|uniref:hypothetical protein n=1 Tax=Myroides sp. WP-1 TaxID=2759944 RepID=UPI0015FBB8EA|nr:hypothetical protein [Myroides sp. WP-1]MBB1140127.1 hypothetical protein [Myroides sp. WP-1]